MGDWIEAYMKMFMLSPTAAPVYESLTLDTHDSNSYNSQTPIKPDSPTQSSFNRLPNQQPPFNQTPNQIRSTFDSDFKKDLTMGGLKNPMTAVHTEELFITEPANKAVENSKPSHNDIVIRKSRNSMVSLSRIKSRSWSDTSFSSRENEEAYVSGMLKGYERGMKISKTSLSDRTNSSSRLVPKKDSALQVPDIDVEVVDESVNTVTDKDKLTHEPNENRGALLFPGIVKRKSVRERLETCLLRNESRLQTKTKLGCARSAKMHALLENNTRFRDSLSHIMDRKHRESINMGIKSFTAMEPSERADLLPHLQDPLFQEKLEGMVKNIIKDKSFYDQLPTMHLPQISAFPPVQSSQNSVDLGKILALSDDIKDMVEYWRTHSLISLNSANGKKGESNEHTAETSPVESEVQSLEPSKVAGPEQVLLEGNSSQTTCHRSDSSENENTGENVGTTESDDTSSNLNCSFPSTECMTSVEGSETSTTTMSDQTEQLSNQNESNERSDHQSDLLKNLDVGQITKLATSAGNLVTYHIVCMTTPGVVVEKCWLYWKVVAIVALSSVERDGRVQVGDILFEIDGQSLRGMDKSAVTQILNTYKNGAILHLTVLKKSRKPDNHGKRLLRTRSIARFGSKCQFLLDDEIRYSSKFKSALEAGGFK